MTLYSITTLNVNTIPGNTLYSNKKKPTTKANIHVEVRK